MPSFDVVSQVDSQEVLNAVNQARKEVGQRYDFKGSNTVLEWDDAEIRIESSDDYKVKATVEVLQSKLAKRQVPLKALEYGKIEPSVKTNINGYSGEGHVHTPSDKWTVDETLVGVDDWARLPSMDPCLGDPSLGKGFLPVEQLQHALAFGDTVECAVSLADKQESPGTVHLKLSWTPDRHPQVFGGGCLAAPLDDVGVQIGDGGKPVFQIVVEHVLGLARLKVQEPEDEGARQPEQGR